MEIDFILHEMTALKYFIPIIIESNKLKIQSNFFATGKSASTNIVL